ncbi:MAG TPA: hypothetical protein VN699_03545 [Pirellulales bacterium]|nr:hypothetical protein [Pirellulales bacterium]
MKWNQVIWDETHGGNVEHVEEHDLTTDDVDHVLENYESEGLSRSSGRPCIFGHVPDGRYIIVIYEEIDDAVLPVTAYEIPGPGERRQ